MSLSQCYGQDLDTATAQRFISSSYLEGNIDQNAADIRRNPFSHLENYKGFIIIIIIYLESEYLLLTCHGQLNMHVEILPEVLPE